MRFLERPVGPRGEITMNPCSRAHVGENRRGETYRLEQNNGKIRGLMRHVIRNIDREQNSETARRKSAFGGKPNTGPVPPAGTAGHTRSFRHTHGPLGLQALYNKEKKGRKKREGYPPAFIP